MLRTLLGTLSLLAASFSLHSASFDFTPSDSAFPFGGKLPVNTYHTYCKNIYSQNGEDGLLEKLLEELGIKEGGTFCEFGASNGIDSSNTYNLILNHNFTGIAIESNRDRYKKCQENYKDFAGVKVFHGVVHYKYRSLNLNAWLKRGDLPVDLDILSIDIDSDDYLVWKGLTDYQPKIVIIETNSYRDPVYDELNGEPSNEYNIDPLVLWSPSRIACGSSFISIIKLGLNKGYIPVAFTGNITFVRSDLVQQLKEFPYWISDNPYDYIPLYSHLVLWGNKWHTNTCLILNVAIGDYFRTFDSKIIDPIWLSKRVHQIEKDSQ